MPRRLTFAAVALAALAFTASDARAGDLPRYTINPHDLDAGIDALRGNNLVWLTSDADRRVGKLLVFIPFGGAANFPSNFQEFGSEAGRLGYHTISLAYKNEVPIANATACGNEELPLPTSPPNCAINARMEILDGRGESPVVNVDRANSIENRLDKVLGYLASTHPEERWAQFLEADGTPKWS